MGITAKATGKSFDPVPEGVTVGRCFGLYDLGTVHDEKWGKDVRKVLIMWELPEHRMTVDRDGFASDMPRAISNRYTLSLHEKAGLRKVLEAWRGKKFTEEELQGFDLKHILGAACQIQVVHVKSGDGSKTYANIGAIMALPKGTVAPKLENPLKYFSFEDNSDLPPDAPEWVAEEIMASKEWQARKEAHAAADEETGTAKPSDDGMPF